MVIVLIGPMGCGKTTIGEILAAKLAWKFYDADDYHPIANIKKMSEGIPLDDNDRVPWLETLHQIIIDHLSKANNMILACSALKQSYREILGIDQKQVHSVFLKGSFELLQSRITNRTHEYMSQELLASQLGTLEEPTTGIVVDISGTPEQTGQAIIDALIK
jgi:carbohydrate kinase (thermoresistant glucokinase family)